MQLRPRDGNGRAIVANDGKLRSFTKIMDQDESDELTYEGVRGGKIYKMLQGGPSNKYVKFAEYKADNDVNKKVPKLKNNYLIVKNMVKAAAGSKDFKTIQALQKYYVGNGLLKESEFTKILKEEGLVEKVEVDENTTDHNDIKAFVDEAIDTYRKMHPNRPIALDNAEYISYVNKVLQRVRKTYLRKGAGFKEVRKADSTIIAELGALKPPVTVTTNKNADESVNGDAIDSFAVTPKGIDVLIDDENLSSNKIVNSANMKESDTIQVLNKNFAKDEKTSTPLKLLIEEMYKQFVRRTEKLVKKEPTIAYQFKDGGRSAKKGKKAHHSRHRDGARSHKRRAAGRSRR